MFKVAHVDNVHDDASDGGEVVTVSRVEMELIIDCEPPIFISENRVGPRQNDRLIVLFLAASFISSDTFHKS